MDEPPKAPPDLLPAVEPTAESPSRTEIDAAMRFVHAQLAAERAGQIERDATLQALVETLVAAGALPPGEFERRRQRLRDKAALYPADQAIVKLAADVDKYAVGPLPDIDCAALMPLCQARCCTLTVFCSPQDLDERVAQWDYAKPYQLRKRDDGYCGHSQPATFRCTIYAQRPAVCRTYDCREDRRIWRDFSRRIPVDGEF